MQREDDREQDLLLHGDLRNLRVVPQGSNYTFIGEAVQGDRRALVVYKPLQGEAPLWDFPDGTLYKREYASCLLSRILGWPDIPLTVVRDGPHGVGTVQRFVHHDLNANYYTLRASHEDAIKRIAVFDLLTNNADRKAAHFLLGADGIVWCIDHGLTFHEHPKLRTVVWDYAGQPVPRPLLVSIERVLRDLASPPQPLRDVLGLLLPGEIAALGRRAADICHAPVFPPLVSPRQIPRGW